jgi:hypothetical protein
LTRFNLVWEHDFGTGYKISFLNVFFWGPDIYDFVFKRMLSMWLESLRASEHAPEIMKHMLSMRLKA